MFIATREGFEGSDCQRCWVEQFKEDENNWKGVTSMSVRLTSVADCADCAPATSSNAKAEAGRRDETIVFISNSHVFPNNLQETTNVVETVSAFFKHVWSFKRSSFLKRLTGLHRAPLHQDF